MLLASSGSAASVLCVDVGAQGANDGSTWANAFTNLQDALAAPSDEIWVAAGSYRPAPPNGDRNASFLLQTNRALYGGFTGTEASRDQRNPAAHVTVLSGDLNSDDGANWSGRVENSAHVVTAISLDATAVLDGFTITSGYAVQAVNPGFSGAGLFIEGGPITLRNCVVRNNLATLGAGLLATDTTLVIEDCRFENNLASLGRGGGIYVSGNTGDAIPHPLTLRRCTFTGNTATGAGPDGYGGGLYADFDCAVDASDCAFIANEARWRFAYGSYPADGGAALTFADGCVFTRCLFRQNRAHEGGALWLAGNTTLAHCLFIGNEAYRVSAGAYDYGGYGGALIANTADVTVKSCTLHANRARSTGGIYLGFNSTAAVANSILWSNTATEEDQKPLDPQIGGASPFTLRYSCVRDLLTPIPGEDPPDPAKYPGCITNAPLFVNERGPDNVPGTADDDLRLLTNSPCLDAGSNALLPAPVTTDVAGNPRRFDSPRADTGAGSVPITDMGAYEWFTPLVLQILPASTIGDWQLNWNDLGAGWRYTVERRGALGTGDWFPVATNLTSPGFSLSPGGTAFHRVDANLLP